MYLLTNLVTLTAFHMLRRSAGPTQWKLFWGLRGKSSGISQLTFCSMGEEELHHDVSIRMDLPRHDDRGKGYRTSLSRYGIRSVDGLDT